MSIVEYAEKVLGIHLWPFQKQFLQKLEKLPSGSRIISTPRGMIIVEDSKMKKEDQLQLCIPC